MNTHLVITLVGADRPGIVERLAQAVLDQQGEWIDSRMANLGGQFAGILRVALPAERRDALKRALESFDGLQVSIAETGAPLPPEQGCRLQLLGQDRPGIVHRVTRELAHSGASVEDMETEIVEASMSGEKLFKARIELRLADGQTVDALRERLETIADELIVDIEFD